ncbi:MAG: hypothetical protein Q8O99_07445 [bacterium]|nr:hypothetical protein [bacterium]
MDIEKGCNLLEAMPDEGLSLEQILREFEEKYLPFCSNFGSTQFM